MSPVDGAQLTAPATVAVNAQASDDGSVTRVEFFSGSTLLADIASAPYQFSWGPLSAGSYTLSARATDNNGLSSTVSVGLSVAAAPAPNPTLVMGSRQEGTTTDYITDNTGAYINANRVQAQLSRIVTTLRAKVGPVLGRYQFAIFGDSNGVPGTLLAQTAQVPVTAGGWQVVKLAAPLPVNRSQWYWIAVWSNDINARVYASNGALRWGAYPFSSSWPSPPVLRGSSPFAYSIHATDE